MISQDLLKVCKDYGVTIDEFRKAVIAEMLAVEKTDKAYDLERWITRISNVLTTAEIISAIKWASWMKQAKELGKKGQTVDEVLALRKAS